MNCLDVSSNKIELMRPRHMWDTIITNISNMQPRAGPATVPFKNILDPVTNTSVFRINSWAGPVPSPDTIAGAQAQSAERLVEVLAPFLILATERTFLSYGYLGSAWLM